MAAHEENGRQFREKPPRIYWGRCGVKFFTMMPSLGCHRARNSFSMSQYLFSLIYTPWRRLLYRRRTHRTCRVSERAAPSIVLCTPPPLQEQISGLSFNYTYILCLYREYIYSLIVYYTSHAIFQNRFSRAVLHHRLLFSIICIFEGNPTRWKRIDFMYRKLRYLLGHILLSPAIATSD